MLSDEIYAQRLRECYQLSQKSQDPSTQNGAILLHSGLGDVLGLGLNDFPHGVSYTNDRWERPKKYHFIEHAERNALYDAAKKNNIYPGSMTLVCPWAACSDCARAMIQMGVIRLITHKQVHELPSMRWMESIELANDMFREAGVEVVYFDGVLGSVPIRVNGDVLTF